MSKPSLSATLGKLPNRFSDIAAFQSWFKASVVTDEMGQPLRVYHGTDQQFAEFETNVDTTRTHGGFLKQQTKSSGVFFSEDREFSAGYGTHVRCAYLKITNPLASLHPGRKEVWDLESDLLEMGEHRIEIDDDCPEQRYFRITPTDRVLITDDDITWTYELFGEDGGIHWALLDDPQFVEGMTRLGYDGALVDEPSSPGGTSWFVINPQNIAEIDTQPTGAAAPFPLEH